MFKELSNTQLKRNAEKREMLAKRYTVSFLKEIASGNFQLYDFFRTLKRYVDKKVEEKKSYNMDIIQECADSIGKDVLHKESLEEKLTEGGISLTFPLTYRLDLGYYKTGDIKKEEYSFFQRINGLKISKKIAFFKQKIKELVK